MCFHLIYIFNFVKERRECMNVSNILEWVSVMSADLNEQKKNK